MSFEIEATAWHEAGHSIAAIANRRAFESVWINLGHRSESLAGAVIGRKLFPIDSFSREFGTFRNYVRMGEASIVAEMEQPWKDDAMTEAVILLAGPFAEASYRNIPPERVLAMQQCQSDRETVQNAINFFARGEDACWAIQHELNCRTTAIIREHRGAIATIARQLMKRGALDYAEVLKIVPHQLASIGAAAQ